MSKLEFRIEMRSNPAQTHATSGRQNGKVGNPAAMTHAKRLFQTRRKSHSPPVASFA